MVSEIYATSLFFKSDTKAFFQGPLHAEILTQHLACIDEACGSKTVLATLNNPFTKASQVALTRYCLYRETILILRIPEFHKAVSLGQFA